MEDLNKQLNLKKSIAIAAIILGLIILYREFVFWETYHLMKTNMVNMTSAVDGFQNKFLERADAMAKKNEEMKSEFTRRQSAFYEKFNKFNESDNDKANTEADAVKNNSSVTQLEAERYHLWVELLNYDNNTLTDQKMTPEVKYQVIHGKLSNIRKIMLKLENLHND